MTAAVPIRAVLFDAMGTLFAPREPVGETYHRFAARAGAKIAAWRLEDAFRRIVRSAPARCFPAAKADERPGLERSWWSEVVRQTLLAADSAHRVDDFERFFAGLFDYYATSAAWRLRPGVAGTLRELEAADLRLGVLSNFDSRLHNILEAVEIANYFSSVTTPASCRYRKPERAAFCAALASLERSAKQTAFVGHDPELDLRAAAEAGLRVFDVSADDAFDELPARILHPATLAAEEEPE